MEREADTVPTGATDNAQPQSDTPETWDYYDPDDDQDTVASEENEGTDDEAEAEPEDTAEDETEAEETDEADQSDDEQAEPALVTLADGSKVTHDELVKGYLRQSDYTRKQQEAANERKALRAEAERIERITQTFVDHLASMVPPEPNPQLALTDPNKFTAQKAQYDAALAQVQRLIQMADEPKQVTQGISQEDHQRLVAAEKAKLTQALPRVATREGWEAFWKNDVQEVAREVGFTSEDLGKAIDHRLFLLVDLAKDGMAARKAKTAAKAKAETAPPIKKPGQAAKQANRNVEAMRKLARSGSIKDALAVDWD